MTTRLAYLHSGTRTFRAEGLEQFNLSYQKMENSMSNPPLNEVNDSSVQTVQDKVPLGLDEPAPILVWRCGLSGVETFKRYNRTSSVFITERAAIEWRQWYMATFSPDSYRLTSEPYRIPLDDAMHIAKFQGSDTLHVIGEHLAVVEVIRL